MGFKEDAIKTLNAAYALATYNPNYSCNHQAFINYVIDNTHLTYKYILFTALLSKATDETINPLCLQKHSQLPGAYDARTICHKVIVPFEMTELNKALGGSNEPFLNKPARFPELDKSNPVRRGNDQNILNALCDNLPLISTQEDAFHCLVYLLCKLIRLKDEKEKLAIFSVDNNVNLPYKLFSFIMKALTHSYEGEVLTLTVAAVYHLLYLQIPNAIVEVHPVNQSGASSKEVSDLDIYIGGKLCISNELKDKDYSATDVRHASDKVIMSGGNRLLFIEGPHASPTSHFKNELQIEYHKRNFQLTIESYIDFFNSMINAIPTIDCHEFMSFIITKARDTKFKEEVIDYLDQLAQQELGLRR